MRIGISITPNSGPATPCEVGSREFEDYTFEVIPLDDCEGIPTAGTVDTEMQICGGNPFTLITENPSSPANGLSRIWQSSPAGQENWNDITDASTPEYEITNGISSNMDYRYKVYCEFSDETVYSDVIQVTLNPASECYCTPEGTNSSRFINNFSTTDAIDNISNLNSGFSTGGYGDFTDMVLSQENTGEVSFEVDIEGGTAGFRIWVDWNQDGHFSSDEVVYQSSGYSSSHSGSFTVPEDVDPGQTRMRIVSHWLSTSGDINPCETGFTYGEFEDYTFEIISLNDCEGMPTAGTPDETEMEVCAGTAFTVSVSDATGAANNLFRRWQSSPAGEDQWTDIGGSSAASFNIQNGITEATDFRYALTCNEEDTAYSDVIEVSLKAANECYCTPPAPTNSDLYWIQNVTTNNGIVDISNTNTGFSSGGYGDFSETHSLIVEPGQDFDFEVQSQNGASPGLKIWIDWNQNGSFEDSGELVYDTSSGSTSNLNTYTGTITVPDDAPYGKVRMRIRNYTGQTPCNQLSYGETEDYTIEIIELEDCEGPVTAGNIEDDFEVCADTAFTVSITDASEPANGLVRQWQSSPAGEDEWTDIENAHSTTLNFNTGITEDTDFRFVVTCNEDETDISEVVTVSLKPANECYCTPGGTSSSYYINNFITTGGEVNFESLNSGHSPNGYGDFTETHTVSQVRTLPVSFEADYEGGTFGTKIWVDWNQDGQFTDDEIVYQTSAYSSSESGSFTVPESAELGNTRMRIGISWTPATGPNSPCESGSREFEDYTFEVLPLEDCEGMPTAGTPDETEIEVCAGNPFTVAVSDATGAANNLNRRWQSSPAGEDDWTDISDSGFASFTIAEGVFEDTDFRYALTCNEEDSAYSDIIQVTLKPGVECYCTPVGSNNNADEIVNFTLANLDNDSAPSEGVNGYSDYTHLGPIQLIPGVDYVASLTSGTGSGSHGAAIWIDYNDDGFFSEDEKVASIPSTITPNSTVDFPAFTASAQVGLHRLRVQYAYNKDGDELDPCNITTGFSETEDYMVLIVDVDCFPPTGVEVNYITDVSAEVSWQANDETSWVVTYGETGFDPETEGTEVQVDGTPSVNLTDLDDDTTYDVYVQTICEDENSVVIGPSTFTTNITPPENTRLCDAIELTPNTGCVGGPYTNVAAFEELNESIGSCLNYYRGKNTVRFTS